MIIKLVGAGLLVLLGIIGWGSIFTVSETEQAIVLMFGKPQRQITSPGLKFKVPLAENVVYVERRILDFDAPKEEVIASDKKRIVVDAYSRYRIIDPLQFYTRVGTENGARTRLATIINSTLRSVMAAVELQTVLSGERRELMRRITDSVNTEANKFGIEIIDVRIKRADLPEANSNAIYRRMNAEREREAKEFRARGAEESQKIKADADRQKAVMLAEAGRKAEILRGEGDAKRNRIYAEAYQKDPEFFSFYRSMEAYRKAMNASDTTLVLSPDSDFFRYFGNMAGATK